MSELVVGSLAGLAANSYVIDVASGSQLTQPGMILDVQSVLKTDTFTASVANGANVAVTDLSITHTLANAANKLLISAHCGMAASTSQVGRLGIAVADDGTLIGIGDAAGSRARIAAGGRTSSGTSSDIAMMPHIHLLYTPGDTGAHTYTVRAISFGGATETLYINRTQADADAVNNPRGASSFTIMEIAG